MPSPRTLMRAAATISAAAALAVVTAGPASAATVSYNVQDNAVSATFKIGFTDLTMPVDGCVAVVAERDDAQGISDLIKNINLDNIVDTLSGERTTVLRTAEGSALAFPVIGNPVTLTANDVPTGVHSLITYCATDNVPVTRTISVGGAENPMGSIVSQGPALISSGMNFF